MTEDTRSGKVKPPVSGADIRTFLLADIRGYTRYTQEHGDDAASALAGRFADLVRETVPGFEGELVELRGDEALCVFRSARQALRASVELQRRLRTGSDAEPAFPLGVGVGLDAGEAVPTQGGYRGAALNLAARLCTLANPGQVLASEGVVHLARRVEGVRFSTARATRVKGIETPVRYVEVSSEAPLPPIKKPPPRRGRRTRWVAGAIAVAASLAVVVVVLLVGVAGGSHGSSGVPVRANSIAVINPATGAVAQDVHLAASPGQVAAGEGGVWVAEEAAEGVVRINPKSGRPGQPVGLGIDPAQLLLAFGNLWVYDAVGNKIAIVDPTGREPLSVRRVLPPCPVPTFGSFHQRICGAGGLTRDRTGLWLGRACPVGCAPPHFGTVWHINPRTFRRNPERGIADVPPERLTFGNGKLWTYGANGARLTWIEPHSRLIHRYPPIPAPGSGVYTNPGLTFAFGSTWIVSPNGRLYQYSEQGQQQTLNIPTGSNEITRGGRWLWITSSAGTLTRVNPYTNTAVHFDLGYPLQGVGYADHRLWVAVSSPNQS